MRRALPIITIRQLSMHLLKIATINAINFQNLPKKHVGEGYDLNLLKVEISLTPR